MDKMEHNPNFEMIHFMKRKNALLTDEELIVYGYMLNLRVDKLTDEEKEKFQKKIDFFKKLLDRVYDSF
jgi:alpha-galactosidase